MWGVSSNYVQLVFNLNIDQQHITIKSNALNILMANRTASSHSLERCEKRAMVISNKRCTFHHIKVHCPLSFLQYTHWVSWIGPICWMVWRRRWYNGQLWWREVVSYGLSYGPYLHFQKKANITLLLLLLLFRNWKYRWKISDRYATSPWQPWTVW
jgi:hypothetical protein